MAHCYTECKLFWTNDSINILGVWVGDHDILRKNYQPLVEKSKCILDTWSKRNLSLFGKINVVNTLIGSLFVYKMMVLPTIPPKIVEKITALIQSFIWSKRKAKISIKVLQGSLSCGRAKLVDLQKKDTAIKISWIKVLKSDKELSNLAYHIIAPVLKEWIWECNLSVLDCENLFPKHFWMDVLKAWCSYNFQEQVNDPTTQIIWWNSHVKINNKPFLWERSSSQNLWYLKQLFQDGRTISFAEANRRFDLSVMDYNSLISAIPRAWKQKLKESVDGALDDLPHISSYSNLLQNPNIVGYVYNQNITDLSLVKMKRKKWEIELVMEIPSDLFLQSF